MLDPPTFSRNADGKVFRVEHDFPALVALCLAVLAPGGWLLASTNHRGLTPARFRRSRGSRRRSRPAQPITR